MKNETSGEQPPKKRGRYSLGDPRTQRIQVYFTEDEYEVVQKKAKSLPLATYVRHAALEMPEIDLQPFQKRRGD